MPPQETPRDPLHISEENAITIEQALQIARAENVSLGKSTLQRWALAWKEKHDKSPVKSVLWIGNDIKTYQLDREDFKVWLFERKQNMRPHEVLQGPPGSQETLQDPKRPRETSAHNTKHSDQSEDDSEIVRKLRDDNMQLKIDVEVRKQLLNQARDEIDRIRHHTENLLRENGELQFQVRQLSEGKMHEQLGSPSINNAARSDNEAQDPIRVGAASADQSIIS